MRRWAPLLDISSAWRAALWYLVITIVMTWPLTPNLARDLPGDLGDPVFICWAIARAADHWLALLSGDLGAAIRFWQAEQMFPEPFITVYSEHFAAHALEILPVWLLTRNIILCYNLLFLSSFVIGAIGMYLLARELTGSPRAAFVAGLMFAFTPYRFAALVHLQGLSSQWMPLALYGLRRYFVTGRGLALAGGASALLLQNLSSGYYMLFFGPFVGAYALVEMGARGLLPKWRVWRVLVLAALAVFTLTLPFSLPYAIVQARLHYRRPIPEMAQLSADLLGWVTAAPRMNIWGWLQTWPRQEGVLFPGFLIVVFAIIGVAVTWRGFSRHHHPPLETARGVALYALVATAVAMWMAMGPVPSIGGRPSGLPSLYMVFYDYVPGYDAPRVLSRFTTVIVLLLAMAAAYGLAWLDQTRRRALLAMVGVGVLLDGAALPLDRNLVFRTSNEVTAPAPRIYPETNPPALWRYLKTLPAEAVLAHLPFGYPEHDIRYLYYSRVDGHRLSNGYSGAFPMSYMTRGAVLRQVVQMPREAVTRLRDDRVTHVIVHTDLWNDDTGARTVAALEGAGMRQVGRFEDTYVLAF